jgi:hypothetical protein
MGDSSPVYQENAGRVLQGSDVTPESFMKTTPENDSRFGADLQGYSSRLQFDVVLHRLQHRIAE